jgi:predicted dehydrogenase
LQIGIVGCGAVSTHYFRMVEALSGASIVACADRVKENAAKAADMFGVRDAGSVTDLLSDPDIDLILNLTPIAAHGEIGLAALQEGKHLYTEKPLATDRETAKEILRLAGEQNLLVASAPDTILGSVHQAARSAIGAGIIGTPVAATAVFRSNGYELSRPEASKYYSASGGGPMFSPGLYFVASLVSMLGPVRRVSGLGIRTLPTRTVGVGPAAGSNIDVQVDTTVAALLEFEDGAIGSLLTSFDTPAEESTIEVHGTSGSIRLSDPRKYGGTMQFQAAGHTEWQTQDVGNPHHDYYGVGLDDLVVAHQLGRQHRLSGGFGYHVLDVTLSIIEAAADMQPITIGSSCKRPSPMSASLIAEEPGPL